MGTTRHGHQAAKKVLKTLTGSEHEAPHKSDRGTWGDGEATQLCGGVAIAAMAQAK
jgi:hypothetical protein